MGGRVGGGRENGKVKGKEWLGDGLIEDRAFLIE